MPTKWHILFLSIFEYAHLFFLSWGLQIPLSLPQWLFFPLSKWLPPIPFRPQFKCLFFRKALSNSPVQNVLQNPDLLTFSHCSSSKNVPPYLIIFAGLVAAYSCFLHKAPYLGRSRHISVFFIMEYLAHNKHFNNVCVAPFLKELVMRLFKEWTTNKCLIYPY